MNFKVIVHGEPAGGYWAEIPLLPGCYSEGDTIEELMANLREAASGYLEVLAQEGRQPDDNLQIMELTV